MTPDDNADKVNALERLILNHRRYPNTKVFFQHRVACWCGWESRPFLLNSAGDRYWIHHLAEEIGTEVARW